MTKKYIVGNVSYGEVLEKILAALEVSPFEEQELRELFVDKENQVSDLEDKLENERCAVTSCHATIDDFSEKVMNLTDEIETLKDILHEDYYAKINNLLTLISNLEDQFN